MTTIIVDRRKKIMISDNMEVTDNGCFALPCKKIYRIEEGPNAGHIVGTTGSAGPGLLFIEWYKKTAERDWLEALSEEGLSINLEEEDFECIILQSKGIFSVDRFFILYPVEAQYYAGGSGAPFALGAMDVGATAHEALAVACQRDPFSSKMNRPHQEMTLT